MNKIVHCITTIERGGAENQLLILAREQVSGGRDVTVVFLKDTPELLEDFQSAGVSVNKSCYEKNLFLQFIWMIRYFKDNDVFIHAHLPRAEILVAATCGCKNLCRPQLRNCCAVCCRAELCFLLKKY